MSYPKQLKLFKAWAKAMEEGATVDRPSYRGTSTVSKAPRKRSRAKTRPRRTRRRKNAD